MFQNLRFGVRMLLKQPGFVAALNTTFLAAIVLTVIALFTSALRGGEKPS